MKQLTDIDALRDYIDKDLPPSSGKITLSGELITFIAELLMNEELMERFLANRWTEMGKFDGLTTDEMWCLNDIPAHKIPQLQQIFPRIISPAAESQAKLLHHQSIRKNSISVFRIIFLLLIFAGIFIYQTQMRRLETNPRLYEKRCRANRAMIEAAVEMYRMDQPPGELPTLEILVSEQYIRKMPVCLQNAVYEINLTEEDEIKVFCSIHGGGK